MNMKPVVLVTRPDGTADKVNALLEERGFYPLACPLLRLRSLAVVLPVDKFDALIFTSANAVRAYVTLKSADNTPVYTVGAETAAFAREQGFTQVTCGGETIEALLSFLRNQAHSPAFTYLNPCGEFTSVNLVGIGDLDIRSVPLYASEFVPMSTDVILRLQSGGIAWILLFSRRSTESFVASMQHMKDPTWITSTRLACLSAKVAEPLPDINGIRVSIAAAPTTLSLLACLGLP